MQIRSRLKQGWWDTFHLAGRLQPRAARLVATERLTLRRTWGQLTQESTLRKFEEGFFRIGVAPAVAFLPAPLAYGMARLRGDLAFLADATLRNLILYNLKQVLGDELTPVERSRVARDCFRLRACEAIDTTRLIGSGQALLRQVEIRGAEHIDTALAQGKGVIICTAHYGSFACMFSLLGAAGYRTTVIGRWPTSFARYGGHMSPIEQFAVKWLIRHPLQHHRSHPNIEPHDGDLRSAVLTARRLRANEVVGTHIDPPPLASQRARTLSVPFLNGSAELLPGVIPIAEFTGAPLLMAFIHRSADLRHQTLEISPPVPLSGSQQEVMARCVAHVEAKIRSHPEHWLYWMLPNALIELGLAPEVVSARVS